MGGRRFRTATRRGSLAPAHCRRSHYSPAWRGAALIEEFTYDLLAFVRIGRTSGRHVSVGLCHDKPSAFASSDYRRNGGCVFGDRRPADALKDVRDYNAMYSSLNELMQFAGPGRSVSWHNPATGNGGDITVRRGFAHGGQSCWEYDRTYRDGGQLLVITGTACEIETGLWNIVREGKPFAKGGSKSAKPGDGEKDVATAATKLAKRPPKPAYDPGMVRETQRLLSELGYDPGPVDGAFGPKTEEAISAYERTSGLKRSGKPSKQVLAALRASAEAATATRPSAVSERSPSGSSGDIPEPPPPPPPPPVSE